jgi:putative ABC transport system substrate-binding protein
LATNDRCARREGAATTTIPIVLAGSSDAVAGVIVANLARPEGNITGFSLAYGDGFAGKWLELLREVAPNVSHVAVLWSSSNAAAAHIENEQQMRSVSLSTNGVTKVLAVPARPSGGGSSAVGGELLGLEFATCYRPIYREAEKRPRPSA